MARTDEIEYLKTSVNALFTHPRHIDPLNGQNELIQKYQYTVRYFQERAASAITRPVLTVQKGMDAIGSYAYHVCLGSTIRQGEFDEGIHSVALALAQCNLAQACASYEKPGEPEKIYTHNAVPYFYPDEVLSAVNDTVGNPPNDFDKLYGPDIGEGEDSSVVWEIITQTAGYVNHTQASEQLITLAHTWYQDIPSHLPVGRMMRRIVVLDNALQSPDNHMNIVRQYAAEQGYIPLEP